MQELSGKVAVVTGAASGIGLAMAERFVAEGMRVVLADVERNTLADVAARLAKEGAEVHAVVTDVADASSVDALADATWSRFGAAHLLCNNAGVLTGGTVAETPLADWDWLLGVNVYGVIHGIRSFLPRMQAQEEEGHIVNTASMAGVTAMPFVSAYHVSKHSVIALSECLYKEMKASDSKIGVSVLCPELVDTRIADADRNRPAKHTLESSSAIRDMIVKTTEASTKTGVPPAEMADRVVRAVREDRFYILSEGDVWRRMAETRCEDVRTGRNPSLEVPEAPAS